ncbi:nuclear pore complex protein GP210 isoform X3 [Beta vulgaris subsp. vulgaris]|uniref:nuclear pore complex protein GP210 isoform X3 n=1 Tax=Beta vulgaris subsp. vulgaris TaxID=3555 RepID=UPI0020374897|nr:nuclear pore complex protein GP210 isoform X3 [Beta vulgaris subsp. vulgaris]
MLHNFNIFVTFAFIFCFNVKNFGALAFSGPHIADVNILLPPRMTHPVEYRLLGSDGCFKWSWDHHDVLSVVPEYNESNHCSTSARLRSIAPYTGRKETAVYAADVRTGTVVRCKVYIDMFSKIQIFHSSIKLDLDGLATLRVRAFDSEDNVFSSLVGLRFMWQLRPQSDKSSHHLVHVPLSDSPLSDCSGFCGDLNIQIKLEDTGVFSDLYVVKGISIGHEIVSVHLREPQFDNMTDEIVLTVAEAMSLDPPSPVLVLVGAIVQYRLKVISGNIPKAVPLPSPFHLWFALNTSIAQVDAMTGLVHALKLGETSIRVEDTRVAGHVQMSSLNVVLPDYMSLYLLPISGSGDATEGLKPVSNARWYVVSGRQYLIELKVFSRGPDAQVIYITKNEDVKLYYDQPKHWKIFATPESITAKYGWQHSRILEATVGGLGKLSASLTYSTDRLEAKEALKVVQEVMVCDQVRVIEEERNISLSSIMLPWSPDIYQEAELNAAGGCATTPAEYRWLSSDSSILSVSNMGVVQAKRPGKATVKVVSIFDNLNFDEVSIEVAVPSSMVMLPYFPVETVVGSHLQASLAMKASNGDFFYRCDAFSSSIKWYSGSDFFIIVNSSVEASLKNKRPKFGPACAQTYLYAASSGRAVLHATFSSHVNNGYSRQISLKASAPVAAFSPLMVHQARDGNKFGGYWFDLEEKGIHIGLKNLKNLYLTPGSYSNVVLVGGPERWRKDIDYIQKVDVLDELCSLPKDGALVQQVKNSEGNEYIILCQVLGNFTLVFKRGNMVGDDHPLPVVAEAILRIDCSFPSSIVVLADEPVNKLDIIQNAIQADRNPGRIRSMPISVANGQTIRVSAVGISNSGHAFANSSSIPLRWELNNCQELASWDEAYNSQMSLSSWERFLRLENASGQCTVHAEVQNHFNYVSPVSEAPENLLQDAIHLQVISMLQVYPEYNLLFFNPDAKMNLSVVGGSCFLEVIVDDSEVVEVMEPGTGLQCSRLNLVPRGVGNAVVKVFDVGLSPPLTAISAVKVSEADWIKIISGKGISLMEGSLILIDLIAGTDDETFESSQYAFMNIQVHIEDQIVDLVDGHDGYVNASNFTIHGRSAGVTTLCVTSRQQSGKEVRSENITIEVYAPPMVHPNDIFLVPGASYVFTVEGGPRMGIFIEYTSMNDSIVAVDACVGRLSGVAPGNATVLATFYGNARTILCQAHGKVRVGVPSAAILNVQSEQLAVGREMPIFPFLIEGDLFSFYELCKDYNWTIENEKVLGFSPAEHLHGNYKLPTRSHEYEQEINFLKVLYGRSGGRSKILLTFTCDFLSPGFFLHSRSYSASLLIRVVPDPPLAHGIPITWILPPHYTTSDLLPSSISDRQTGSTAYSLLGCSGLNDDEWQKGAISISGSRIITTNSNDLACIQAKDLSTGRIEVATCLKVAEVAQIRFLRKLTFYLAVGSELELPVYFYDNLGNPFLEAHNVVVFDIDTNFKDILAIDKVNQNKESINIKAMRHGTALVAVRFDRNPKKSDYIMISVGAHINPQDPIAHPGSNLSFIVEENQAPGEWSSSDESVISVDSQSGKAVAVGKGTAAVMFQSSILKLQTTVSVLHGDLITVDTPADSLTNTPLPPGGYKFSVKFSSNHGLGAPSTNVELPYECQVEPTFVGHAKPWKDLDSGDSYCLFFPFSPEHLAHTVPTLKDERPDISISVHAKLREARDVSGSASALFLGGFSILDMDKDILQLNMSPNSNRSIITLVGNTDVSLHWLNRDLFTVRTLVKEGSGIGGRALYEVEVLKRKPFKEILTFTLPVNGQRVDLIVNYEADKEKESTINSTLLAGAMGFTLLILSIIIYKCFLGRPDSTHPSVRSSVAFQAQNIAAPQTPDRTSLAPQTERSPQTPQPFIDYVRRTIDETPYYRRERRRRFDPQNTY